MKYAISIALCLLAAPATPQGVLMPEGYVPCPMRLGICQVELVGSRVSVIYGFPGKWTAPAVFDLNFPCKEANWVEPGTVGIGGVTPVPFVALPGSICMIKPNQRSPGS